MGEYAPTEVTNLIELLETSKLNPAQIKQLFQAIADSISNEGNAVDEIISSLLGSKGSSNRMTLIKALEIIAEEEQKKNHVDPDSLQGNSHLAELLQKISDDFYSDAGIEYIHHREVIIEALGKVADERLLVIPDGTGIIRHLMDVVPMLTKKQLIVFLCALATSDIFPTDFGPKWLKIVFELAPDTDLDEKYRKLTVEADFVEKLAECISNKDLYWKSVSTNARMEVILSEVGVEFHSDEGERPEVNSIIALDDITNLNFSKTMSVISGIRSFTCRVGDYNDENFSNIYWEFTEFVLKSLGVMETTQNSPTQTNG